MAATILGIVLGAVLACICGFAFMLVSSLIFNLDSVIGGFCDGLMGRENKQKDTWRDYVVLFFLVVGLAIGGYCGWTFGHTIL